MPRRSPEFDPPERAHSGRLVLFRFREWVGGMSMAKYNPAQSALDLSSENVASDRQILSLAR